MLRQRVVTLDDSDNGTVGTPPARYFGCFPFTVAASNLGRTLTAGDDFLLWNTAQVVSGDIVVAGAPNSEVQVLLES